MSQPFVYQLTDQKVLVAQPDSTSAASPGPGQMVVQTLMTAISPGTELAAWAGAPPLRPTPHPYPRLMGYCNVGRVTDLGPGIDGFCTGDLVLTHSAHRTHDMITAAQVLCKIPEGADLATVSATYRFHLGYMACLKAKVAAGDQVAVIGLGTLGMTSAAVAHLAGAQVTGFSNHLNSSHDMRLWGLSKTHHKTNYNPSSSGSFDSVLSTTNIWSDWQLALEITRRGGTIVPIGFPGRGQTAPDFNPLASQYFYDKQLTIAACGYVPNLDVAPIDLRFTLKRNCTFLMQAIIDGRLPAADLVEDVRPATDLAKTYAEMATQRSSGRTIVLDWQKGMTCRN